MNSGTSKRFIQQYGSWLVLGFAVVILLPVIINFFPLHYSSPDIQYVKAKVLRVLAGEIYADPITGFDNFHPPVYHLILALPALMGIPLDYILLLVTFLNVFLLLFFLYKLISQQFDNQTALFTCMLVPFVVEFMGCGNLFLATAFYFAIPLYLAGLFFFLKPDRTISQTAIYAALWGVVYVISPAYLFLIGLPMLYELIIKKDFKRFGTGFGVILVALIPFWHQAYQIFSQKLFGTSAFAFWRGFPDFEFAETLVTYIINPTGKELQNPLVWVALVITILAVTKVIKSKGINKWFILSAVIGYLLTFYNFKPQYAIRIHLFISFFLIATLVYNHFNSKKQNQLITWGLIAIALCGIGFQQYKTFNDYGRQNGRLPGFEKTRAQFKDAFGDLVTPEETILAFHGTYRHYIMPFYPVHALKAYESGEYFQLTSTLSAEYQKDYDLFLKCNDQRCLDYICNKYNIKTAVANGGDFKYPVFPFIDKTWETVYSDPYFRVYKRPGK